MTSRASVEQEVAGLWSSADLATGNVFLRLLEGRLIVYQDTIVEFLLLANLESMLSNMNVIREKVYI